ncbi:integrase catalytic domain-containing protein [Trichonephila clavipes]|nr:integrase catalytic domain-containing protein [Trichonephila clavipes]
MYKNALKEDLIRVVEDLDGTVESTDTIAKLKTKIENSSTFESDPDFVKTLIENCIDERVSRNEREATLEKQKIELAKLQLEKEVELQTAKNKALSLNPAAKVEDKQFETNIENMITSIKTLSLPVPTRSENFNLFFQSLECTFLTKKEELNDYEKLKSIVLREFQLTPRECLNSFKNAVKSSGETYIQFAARLTANFQYYCSLRKVNSFESLCDLLISDKLFETLNKETATHISIREAEDWFRPIDLAKECDIYISSKNGSCAHAYAHSNSIFYVSNVSVASVIENSSYDLPNVKNFNTRNDLSSLVKNYKCNNIKSTKLKMCIKLKNDIPVCQRARRLSCSEKLQVNDQIDDWLRQGIIKESVFDYCSPMKSKHRRFVLLQIIFELWQWKRRKKRNRFEQTSRTLERKISIRSTKELIKKGVLMAVKHNFSCGTFRMSKRCLHMMEKLFSSAELWYVKSLYICRIVLVCSVFFVCFRFSFGLHGRTAADSVQSGWPVMASSKAVFARRRSELKLKLLDCELLRETAERTTEVREQALPSAYHRQTYLLE